MTCTAALSLLALAFSSSPSADSLPRRGVLGVPFSPAPAEVAAKYSLAPGQGAVAGAPVAQLTGERAGLRAGDVLISINGKPVTPQTIGSTVREIPAGSEIRLTVGRDGKQVELKSTLQEKPRDPGNANYEVRYDFVVSNGQKMRTIITLPKKPGKHPGFFFIQGFSPVSYDFTLEGSKGDVTTIDGPILFDFANSDFVTMRVEKPGVGDSEGGPFADLDYTTELDIYRQAMKQLRATPGVDVDNIFIFGHSMGGSFGPMVACEFPVKGLAVYGTAGRTWFEYLMDTIRYQGLVGGQSFEDADDDARKGAKIMSLAMLEKKSADEIKKLHPELATDVDAYFPGGRFNGKTLDFWRQLAETNFSKYWAKCNSHVLAIRGVADFVTYDADHKLIADIVNVGHPGWGKFMLLPNSDHLFHNFPTEQASMRNFQRGQFNNDFSGVVKKWIAEVMGAPDP